MSLDQSSSDRALRPNSTTRFLVSAPPLLWRRLFSLPWPSAFALLAFSEIFSEELGILEPCTRDWPRLGDVAFSFPLKKASLPSWAAVVLCSAISTTTIFCCYKMHSKERRITGQSSLVFLTMLRSIAVCELIVNVLKWSVGRPRPHYLSLSPAAHAQNGLTTGDQVHADHLAQHVDSKQLRKSRLSFPSGHASTAFCTMTILARFVLVNLEQKQGKPSGLLTRLLVFAPFYAAATAVSVSRVFDYHHHWSDVLAGGIIGAVCGWMGFAANFASVSP